MDNNTDVQILAGLKLVNQQEIIQQAQGAGLRAGQAFQQGFSSPLGRITGRASEFQKSMEAASARVVAFGAVAGQIYAVKTAFEKLVSSTIEVQKELANINLYLNLGADGLKNFSSSLFAIATKTSQPFADAAKAAQEFARQGLTTNEILKRTNDALSLTKLTGMGMEESISDLTSIMNSFSKESLNTTLILDRLAGVGGRFAVSADAIAEALKRVGSSATDAGVSFDSMVSLITAAQHITGRSATVIGNALKSIFTRLERPKVLEDLEAVGVQIRNTTGQVLPLMDVIRNLSQRYDTLSTSQKSFISETVGGVFQINTLKAILGDLGSGFTYYDAAMKAATDSTGIAQKRIEELNQTLSSKLQQTMTIWQQTLSNIGNLSVINPIKGGIKFANNLGNQVTDLTNPNNNSGSATAVQGALKGIGNVLSGPALQIGISLLYKLFDKLVVFGYQAYKNISGITEVSEQRANVEKKISQELLNQNSELTNIIKSGANDLQIQKEILDVIRRQNAEQDNRTKRASIVTSLLQSSGNLGTANRAFTTNSAVGFIPEAVERSLARSGGYSAGNVVSTNVFNGSSSKSVIANTAETISEVKVGGKKYQWINPPENSPAGMAHAKKSMVATGINPYELGQRGMYGLGMVPNLSLDQDKYNYYYNLIKKKQLNYDDIQNWSGYAYWDKGPMGKYNKSPLLWRGTNYDELEEILSTGSFKSNWKNSNGEQGTFASASLSQATSYANPIVIGLRRRIPGINLQNSISHGMGETATNIALKDPVKDSDLRLILEANKFGPRHLTKLKKLNIEEVLKHKIFAKGLIPSFASFGEVPLDWNEGGESWGGGMSAFNHKNNSNTLNEVIDKKALEFTHKIPKEKFSGSFHRDFLSRALFHGVQGTSVKELPDREILNKMGFSDSYLEVLTEGFAKEINVPELRKRIQQGEFAHGLVPNLVNISDVKQRHPQKPWNNLSELTLDNLKALRAKSSRMWKSSVQSGNEYGTAEHDLNEYQLYDSAIKSRLKYINKPVFASGLVPSLAILDTYHGTAVETIFDTFRKGDVGFHSGTTDQAEEFVKFYSPELLEKSPWKKYSLKAGDRRPRIYPLKTKINNPLRMNDMGSWKQAWWVDRLPIFSDKINPLEARNLRTLVDKNLNGKRYSTYRSFQPVRKYLKKLGYDGIVYTNEHEGEEKGKDSYIAFYPNQIKSKFNPNPDWKKRSIMSAQGFIPQESVQNALDRENKATHGNAVLSSSPILITDQNPLGLVAIDSRTQSNADEAIRQHQILGQSLNDIRTGNIKKVPNLDIGDSSFLLTSIMSMGKGISSTNNFEYSILKFKNWFEQLTDATQKQVYTMYKLNEVQEQLTKGKGPVSFTLPAGSSNEEVKKYTIGSLGQFQETFKDRLVNSEGIGIKEQISRKEEMDRRENGPSQDAGFKLSIASDLLGAFVSQGLKDVSPNTSRGTEKLFTDLGLAGQAKMFLPGNKGNIAAAGLAGEGVAAFLKEMVDGTAKLEQSFGKQQEIVQKTSSSIDALVQSISNLDNMTLDSSVSFEALTREQRKFEESLDQFSGSGVSQESITKVRTAPNSKSRIKALEEIKDEASKNLDNSALNLDLKQLIGKKSGVGGTVSGVLDRIPVFGKRFNNIFDSIGKSEVSSKGGLFGFSDPAEKEEQSNRINSIAAQALSNMSDTEKNRFEKETLNPDISSKLSINNLYGSKNQDIRNNLSQGTDQDRSLVVEQAKFLATQSAIQKNPEAREAINNARTNSQQARLPLDLMTRQLEAYKRTYVNSTDLNINYSDQREQFKSKIGYSQKQSQLGLDEGYAGVLSLTAGNKSVLAYQQNIEAEKTKLQSQQKISEAGFGFTQKLASGYAQNTEPVIQEALKNGQLTALGEQSLAIPEYQAKIDKALNEGLSNVVTQNKGDVSKFIGQNGQFDFSEFNKNVLDNSGVKNDEKLYGVLKNILETNQGSVEQLKTIEEYSDQVVNLNIEGNQAIKDGSNKYINALKEYQIQMNSSTLGGVKAFQNPMEGGKLIGEYMRNRAMSNSSNPIIQGRGAVGMLEWMKANSGKDVSFGVKQQNGLYDETSNDKVTNEQSHYANQFLKGYYQNQQTMIGRMNPEDPVTIAMKQRMQKEGYGIGRDTLETLIHPEKNTSTVTADTIADGFKNSLNSSLEPINHFSSSLSDLVTKINKINFDINKPSGLRQSTDTQVKAQDDIVKGVLEGLATQGKAKSTVGQQLESGSKTGIVGQTLGFVGDHVGGIAAAGLFLGGTRYGRKITRGVKNSLFKERNFGLFNETPEEFKDFAGSYSKGKVSRKGYEDTVSQYKKSKLDDITIRDENENDKVLEKEETRKQRKFTNEQLQIPNKQIGYNKKSPLLLSENASVGSPTRFESVNSRVIPQLDKEVVAQKLKENMQGRFMFLSQDQLNEPNNPHLKHVLGQNHPTWKNLEESGHVNIKPDEYMGKSGFSVSVSDKYKTIEPSIPKSPKLLNAPVYEPNYVRIQKNTIPSMGNIHVPGKFNVSTEIPDLSNVRPPKMEPTLEPASGGTPKVGETTEDFIKRFKSHGKLGKGLAISAGLLALGGATSASAATFQNASQNSTLDNTLSLGAGFAPLLDIGINKFAPNSKISKFLNKGSFGFKGNLATTALDIGAGFIGSREDYGKKENKSLNTLENVASIAGYIPGGKFAYAGVKAGEAIDDLAYKKFIQPNDRLAKLSKDQNQSLLDNNPVLNRIQSLRGQITSTQKAEQEISGNKNLSSEKKQNAIAYGEEKIQQLTQSINQLRESFNKINSQEGKQDENRSIPNIPITVEISIKDIGNLPGIIDQKIITPIKVQLSQAFGEIGDLRQKMGISSNPPQINR